MTGRKVTAGGRLMGRAEAVTRLAELNRRAVASCPLCSRRLYAGGQLHRECAARVDRCPGCGRSTSTCRCAGPVGGAA